MPQTNDSGGIKRIEVQCDGPYKVEGGVPLAIKTQVVSEFGEPLTWKKEGEIETEGTYFLCRCGHSSEKPFCDGTHDEIGFDGTERASTSTTAERQAAYPGSVNIYIKRDHHLCMQSGFCGNRKTNVGMLAAKTADTQVRAQVMAMIERCPAGALTYSLKKGEPDIEPDLPQQIAVTTEITSGGPIAGPLWVTGSITVERSDGQPLETRNRVTLCSCGRSSKKPLCDGTHRMHPTKR